MRIITATLILLFSYLTLADTASQDRSPIPLNAAQSQAVTPELLFWLLGSRYDTDADTGAVPDSDGDGVPDAGSVPGFACRGSSRRERLW